MKNINWPAEIRRPLPWEKPQSTLQAPSWNNDADLHKRISAYMAKIPPSIEGNGGDDQLFDAARALVISWGLSQQEALSYMRVFNARCEPPWPEHRLVYKLKEADEKSQHGAPRGHLRGEGRTSASAPIPKTSTNSQSSIIPTQDELVQSEPELTNEELKEYEKAELERYRIKDRPFPTAMSDTAFYGIAGDIVQIIAQDSEASREAILAQFLVSVGNQIGRGPYRKQASFHHMNESVVLVGETSIGRKGTSWEAVKNLLPDIGKRERDGLQSGEAVIHCVRDAIYGIIPVNKRKAGQADKAETTLLDPGVDDKRLLIMEEEFARLLNVATRPGNTLSSVLRKGWDGRFCLYVDGKISPCKATEAHISMIGHVTAAELMACISEVENKNGFSNRVLWVAVQRIREISIPAWIDWSNYPQITTHLATVLETFGPGTSRRHLEWSKEGRTEWDLFYKSKSKLISSTSSGIVGSIIARSHAHVLRLTMLYTVLDNSTLMEPKHLRAAIAFWQYCEQSAIWVFGQKTGNKEADKMYWALQRAPKGMTRTQINMDVFNNHAGKVTLDQAFSALLNAGLVRFEMERVKGRPPSERWFARGERT